MNLGSCSSSGKGGRRAGGTGLSPNDILSTRDMISERHKNSLVDEVLTVSRDLRYEYGLSAEVYSFQIAELKPKASAIAYYDGSNIAVNSKFMKADRLDTAYDECVKQGFHPSKGNKTAMQAVASHEFGHAINDAIGKKMGMDIDSSATKIVNEARKQTKHRGVVQMASKISGYATHSNAEAIAEAVSDVYCNGKKARSESRAIVNVVKSYLN